MTLERKRNRIEVSSLQNDGKDYIVLTVGVGHDVAGASEYIERGADVETVAKQLEWLATKLRASAAEAGVT